MITKLTDMELLDDAIIGTGACSKVVRCRLKSDKKVYALKIVDMKQVSELDAQHLMVEMELHKGLKHPNIVRLYSYYKEGDFYYFLMDYCPCNTLYFYIHVRQGLPEMLALRFLYQTALAIDYLHNQNILHRDIKPENLLVDEGYNIRVCDFGWGCKLGPDRKPRKSVAGTFEYMSPEVVFEEGHGFPADVWTLGVLLYEMIHGTGPYSADTHEEMKRDFKQVRLRYSRHVTPPVKELLDRLLTIDASKRITVKELLRHPTIASNIGEFTREVTPDERAILENNNYLNQLSARRAVVRTVNGVPVNEIPNYGKVINAPVPGSEAIPRSQVEADRSRGGFAVENTQQAFTAQRPVDLAQLSAYSTQQATRSLLTPAAPVVPGATPLHTVTGQPPLRQQASIPLQQAGQAPQYTRTPTLEQPTQAYRPAPTSTVTQNPTSPYARPVEVGQPQRTNFSNAIPQPSAPQYTRPMGVEQAAQAYRPAPTTNVVQSPTAQYVRPAPIEQQGHRSSFATNVPQPIAGQYNRGAAPQPTYAPIAAHAPSAQQPNSAARGPASPSAGAAAPKRIALSDFRGGNNLQ